MCHHGSLPFQTVPYQDLPRSHKSVVAKKSLKVTGTQSGQDGCLLFLVPSAEGCDILRKVVFVSDEYRGQGACPGKNTKTARKHEEF